MEDLLTHFAAVRAPHGQRQCDCCEGSGSHGAQGPCTRCTGTGFVAAASDEPWCPARSDDQPAPARRRHWREPKTAGAWGGRWFHGTDKDYSPGDVISPGNEVGQHRHGPEADSDHLWISDDAYRAGSYGHRTYEVVPHTRPKRRHSRSDEHTTTGADVLREITDAEAREQSPSYQKASRAYGRQRKQGILHGPDELPPDPGTAPIPEGHVRLWHYTRASNVPSIREHGLLRSHARGDSGTGDLSEPSAGVWASTKRPDDVLDDHTSGNAAVVEYHAHPDEISGNAESPWQAQRKGGGYDPEKLKDWASGYHHVIMHGDVHPHQMLAIHEGWHGAARYMKHDDPSLKSYQWIHDESNEPWNNHLNPYRRGLQALERERGQHHEAARQREGDERPYGDYTMRYRTEDQGERRPRHVIETHHPDDGKVGELNWYGTTGTIHNIDVDEGHARRGIATAMWNWGQEMTPRPKHSGDRTEMGKGWAKSVGGPGLRKRQGGQRGNLPALEYYHVLQGREKGGYHAVAAAHDGQVIGHLTWGPNSTKIQQLWVHPQYRRQGIADAIHARARWVEPGLEHHTDRTGAGEAWASATGDEVPGQLHDTTSDSAERKGAFTARMFQERLDGGHRTMKRLAVMAMPGYQNPHTRGDEWFHGTKAFPEELSQHGFEDPMEMDTAAYEHPDGDPEGHWNQNLGTHFTADHDIAKDFATGQHSSSRNSRGEGDPWRGEARGIVHARLGMRNPKVYASEHDMDHEAYEHEWKAGNSYVKHLPQLESDDEDDRAYTEEMWPEATRIHQQFRQHKIPRDHIEGAFGYGMNPHPTRTTWLNRHPDRHGISQRFRQRLQDAGHDGIIYGNEYEVSKHGGQANKSAIVFHPHQIQITQHHDPYGDHLSPEQAEHQQARMPGYGQQELPFEHRAAWTPSERIFGPTFGLDHRLFETNEKLRPAVRQALLSRVEQVLEPVLGPDWQRLTRIWLAGSQASKWTGPDLEGNGDLDILIGLSHTHARLASPSLASLGDAAIEHHLNTILRARFNESHWHPPFDPSGQEYDLTGYVIHVSDIRRINPYAAYNLTDDDWTIEPPDMPSWSAEQFPQGPAVFAEARALASQVRAILRLPEPFRAQEAARIWHYIHEGRNADFTEHGLGWQGTGNVLEKALDQAHGNLVGKLKNAAYDPPDGPQARAHGMTTADLEPAHA